MFLYPSRSRLRCDSMLSTHLFCVLDVVAEATKLVPLDYNVVDSRYCQVGGIPPENLGCAKPVYARRALAKFAALSHCRLWVLLVGPSSSIARPVCRLPRREWFRVPRKTPMTSFVCICNGVQTCRPRWFVGYLGLISQFIWFRTLIFTTPSCFPLCIIPCDTHKISILQCVQVAANSLADGETVKISAESESEDAWKCWRKVIVSGDDRKGTQLRFWARARMTSLRARRSVLICFPFCFSCDVWLRLLHRAKTLNGCILTLDWEISRMDGIFDRDCGRGWYMYE